MKRSHPSGAKKRSMLKDKNRTLEQMKGSLLAYTVSMNNESSVKDLQTGEIGLFNNQPSTSDCSNDDSKIGKGVQNSEENILSVIDCSKELDHPSSSVCSKEDSKIEETVQDSEENIKSVSDCPEELNSSRFDEQEYDEDPATWEIVTDEMREYFLKNPVPQNMNLIHKTERKIGDKKRSLTEAHFYRLKSNQQKVQRDWLILSPSTFALFCWICKLFSKTFISSLSTTGYSDWKHTSVRLHEHENSYCHREAVCTMIQRKETSSRIDSSITEQANCESKYWYEVLRRVVAVTKFLSTRGLSFFGRNETIGSCSNGNFLGCMELISEFDPFLAKHLQKYGNPGSGRTSYLSSTTLNEFIDLMANKVCHKIAD